MKIMFINNDGAGFADTIEINSGTTVEKLFREKMGSVSPNNYMIRVNRAAVSAGQVLNEGDRVTITATKIAGAVGPVVSDLFSRFIVLRTN